MQRNTAYYTLINQPDFSQLVYDYCLQLAKENKEWAEDTQASHVSLKMLENYQNNTVEDIAIGHYKNLKQYSHDFYGAKPFRKASFDLWTSITGKEPKNNFKRKKVPDMQKHIFELRLIPQNESQDLNYHESFTGEFSELTARLTQMIKNLKIALPRGEFTAKIQSLDCIDEWYFSDGKYFDWQWKQIEIPVQLFLSN